MQQAMTALQALVGHQQHRQDDDNGKASVQGGGDAHAPNARDRFAGQAGSRGNGGHGGGCARGGQASGGRGFAPQRVRRQCDNPNFAQPVHYDEDGLSKPKFTMPKFVGSTNVEEYLNWELKVEKLWRMHEYIEDKKIKLASSEFDDYALIWWDNLVQSRIEDGYPPIVTWRVMNEELRARFVPHNYIRSLYDRL
jgi:ribosomal protein L15